jgi:hypothetical protein
LIEVLITIKDGSRCSVRHDTKDNMQEPSQEPKRKELHEACSHKGQMVEMTWHNPNHIP